MNACEELWSLLKAIVTFNEEMGFTGDNRLQTWRGCAGKIGELAEQIEREGGFRKVENVSSCPWSLDR